MRNDTILSYLNMFSNTNVSDDHMFSNTTLSDVTSNSVVLEDSTLSQYSTGTVSKSVFSHDDNSSLENARYTYDYESFDYGDEYMYPGYDFERALYLYIWEILVIVTSLVNVVVISVLLRRKMRNPTNIILAAIAISDSLTGLVTLPTYIMVYQNYDPLNDDANYNGYYLDNSTETESQGNAAGIQYDTLSTKSTFSGSPHTNYSSSSMITDSTTQEALDGYTLTKSLCNGFMISKYFLSKTFHSVSIFLTLFLGIQRYVSVAFPYKSQFLFNVKRTLVCCVIIFVVSPLLHSYHLGSNKATGGLCQWEMQDKGCGGVCIYLWVAFFVRHFLPCLTLVVFSVLFIFQLRLGERSLRRMDSNRSQISRRVEENRRISIIVTAIVIIFLVPEVPYGIFLLYNAIDKAANEGRGIDLETNRAIQMTYELLLVLSFHANFYIYTLFNRRFRKVLYRTIVKPVRRLVGDTRRLSITRTSSTSHQGSTRKTTMTNSKTIDSKIQLDTNWLHTNDSDKSSATEMQPLKTFVAEKRPSEHELEPLNEKI
ncbi:uncharacterized protein LOC123526527 [Mercenaria mercenaria]|uniref:uncharacterized protein LOC123526527 n=1 Tax=Mercenaria mercenaria TaxID=6596 RepID=UPI00234EB965|nr:uncharacterized protein LOC123526527 [Mercenaria mercenaria]XP_053378996.1 uncharacterized protein LOC123526527 [Mercenaria mercenaria]